VNQHHAFVSLCFRIWISKWSRSVEQ